MKSKKNKVQRTRRTMLALFSQYTNHQTLITNLGFTLIELLVVIAIIAALAGISIFALGGSRKSARDSKRKADLESIKSALEIYKADVNQYPVVCGSLPSPLTSGGNTYMQNVPVDPTTSSNYYFCSNGTTYRICAVLEDPGTPIGCIGCAACNYKVDSP